MTPDEANYRKIGRRTGPHAAASARQAVQEYWVARGADGARWLAERIATEPCVEALDGVANLLADLGTPAIGPIREALARQTTGDQSEALARALGWIEEEVSATPDLPTMPRSRPYPDGLLELDWTRHTPLGPPTVRARLDGGPWRAVAGETSAFAAWDRIRDAETAREALAMLGVGCAAGGAGETGEGGEVAR